jgi:hypothetical protein
MMELHALVGGTIVVPHLRRAYEFWEALDETSTNSICLDSKVVSDLRR